MRNFIFIILLVLGFVPYTAKASYSVYTPDASFRTLDQFQNVTNTRVHVIVAGHGGDLGANAMISAFVQALHLKKLYPQQLVVVYVANPESHRNLAADVPRILRNSFTSLGEIPVVSIGQNFSNSYRSVLLRQMDVYRQIASFHIFSHASIKYGIKIGKSNRTDTWNAFEDEALTTNLKGNFAPDAYAYIHGCNGGHVMAWWLSKSWGIPVAGSLTWAHFEVASATEGNATQRKKYVVTDNLTSNWSTMRMKSDDVLYNSPENFGTYQHGLPMYKFFCVELDVTKCRAGMARSVLSSITQVQPDMSLNSGEQRDRDYYGRVLRESLCPTDRIVDRADRPGNQKQCIDALLQLTPLIRSGTDLPAPLANYMPLRGAHYGARSAQCQADNSRCYAEVCYAARKYTDEEGAKVLVNDACAKIRTTDAKRNYIVSIADPAVNPSALTRSQLAPSVAGSVIQGKPYGSTTFVDEYASLLLAFEQIKDTVPNTFSIQ